MEYLIGLVVFLILMLIVQQAYWMWVVQKLINKLMSKNFGEYVQVQQISKETKKPTEEEFVDKYAERQAQAANSMMGMI